MKINSINCILNSKDIGILKKFISCIISISSDIRDMSVFPDVRRDIMFFVKLQRDDEIYFVTNEPTVQIDLDEYPVLTISSSLDNIDIETYVLENVKLLNIFLIRDEVSWIRDEEKYELETDIGMKIVTDQGEICFIAWDNVGGVMSFTFGDNIKIPDSENDLKDQWGFKADEFISLSRKLIPIA